MLDFIGGDAVDVSTPLVRPSAAGGTPPSERAPRIVSIANVGVRDAGGRYVFVRPDTADLTALAQLADEGKLTVSVDTAVPLAEAAEAWQRSIAGRARGKIILEIR